MEVQGYFLEVWTELGANAKVDILDTAKFSSVENDTMILHWSQECVRVPLFLCTLAHDILFSLNITVNVMDEKSNSIIIL